MMKKVWLVLLAVVLVFGLAVLGCSSGSSSSGGGPGDGGDGGDEGGDNAPPAFTADGPFDYTLWGSNKPVLGDDGFLSITASSSTGFIINFADIDYTYDARDILTFTYEIEVTTPVAVVIAKTPSMGDLAESGGAGWGKGKGWEYALGDAARSIYDGPLVKATWDAATKTGTFEVLVKLLPATATGIGFQHNVWADTNGDGVKIAENSKYKVRFLKIENATARGEESGGGGDEELTPEQQEAAFAAAVGIKGLTQASSGNNIVIDTDTGIISRVKSTGYGSWVSVAIPAASLTPAIIASDTIVVSYIGIGNANIIPKLSDSTSDLSPAMYTTLTGDGTVRTLEIPAFRYGLSFPTSVWTFQGNNSSETDWKVKITDITVRHGDPIRVALAIPLKAPVGGLPPSATVDTIQYTGAVEWTPTITANFVTGTAYTATITLTKRAGYTFAGIETNTFTVSGATTVTHAAGTAGDTIVVTAVFPNTVAPPEKSVTFTDGDVKSEAATITDVTATGFTMEQTANYGNSYAYFKVKFADGFKLSNYSKIDCKLTLLGTTYKPLCVMAFADEPSGWKADTTIIAGDTSSNAATDDNTETPVTLTIGAVGAEIDLNEVWIAIRSNASSGTKYKITDIKFYN